MSESVKQIMLDIGKEAKDAAQILANVSSEVKNQAIKLAASNIRESIDEIIQANQEDVIEGKQKGLTPAMLDRLELNADRINNMANGLVAIAELNDPVSRIIDSWERPNGLSISRVSVPLGVIGIIYESRPNVTADAGGLCLKSGNASILRGGSESFHSSSAIFDCLKLAIEVAGLPTGSIQMVPTKDRVAVGEMLTMTDFIDVIVPRGGRSLVERVQREAKIPIFAHLEGICHTYVNAESSPDMACDIVFVVTPPQTHYEVCKHFLKKGVNVFCEKPLTLSEKSSYELLNVGSGKFISVTDLVKKAEENKINLEVPTNFSSLPE